MLFSVKKRAEFWDKGQVVVQPLGAGERKLLIDGGADGRFLPTGHLVYAVQGTLLAVTFDPANLAVTGGPVPIVEGVRRGSPDVGGTQFTYSGTGSLAYLPGPVTTASAATDLAVFDRKGSMQPLKLPPGPYRSPRVSPDGKLVTFDSEVGTRSTRSRRPEDRPTGSGKVGN